MTIKQHPVNTFTSSCGALLGFMTFALPQTATAQNNDGYNRGIGLYPGNPKEWFVPDMTASTQYRNVALNRATTASSSYDYNLTGQLVTDGIIDTGKTSRLIVTTPKGVIPKIEREFSIDGGQFSQNVLMGSRSFINYQWTRQLILADRVVVTCRVVYNADKAKGGYTFKCSTANTKGKERLLGEVKGNGLPGEKQKDDLPSDPNKQTSREMLPVRNIKFEIPLSTNEGVDNIKLQFQMPGAHHWMISDVRFYNGRKELADVLPSYKFSSVWMSESPGRQWLETDLGAPADIDAVRIHWVNKAVKGQIETSFDGKTWAPVASLPGGTAMTDNISCKARARYVRLIMTKPARSGELYAITELEIMGKGGLVTKPHAPEGIKDGRLMLGGGDWILQHASQVKASGEELSQEGTPTEGWITATVPGTVLMSYVNIGALPHPNYDDNINQISESFFNSDFWYRTSFNVPDSFLKRHTYLCFDGINWKADVYLNGRQIDRIEGAFKRGRTDVSNLLKKGTNTLAVRVIKNEHYGAVKEKTAESTSFNGGILGADNPTFHATIGWDWITTVRGRDMGIWNDVYLKNEGDVSVADPLVNTRLAEKDTTVTLSITTDVKNSATRPVTGTLRAWVGDVSVEKQLSLGAGQQISVLLTDDEFPELANLRMRLWWPNGYGEPYLHDAGVAFIENGVVSDSLHFKAGLRQVTYRDENTQFKIYINNRRLIPFGGNWGFSEHNLCYRGREYDIAVDYHRQMHFNMIRNWVGQTGDKEFYDACDRHGIMVWQDFWLANPVDGPDPYDNSLFMNNASDYINRIRRHPSIAFYCGRNEGYPSKTLNPALRALVDMQHPGMAYIPSSADDGVSGHGPYRAMPIKYYFEHTSGRLHSERGMPNVMNYESLERAINPEHVWPQSRYWGLHDYTMKGAQGGESFNKLLYEAFGQPQSAEEFATLAQWINYDGYRAMYESGSRDRQGLLIWMSHPCWPSMVWQTYDYYFDPNGGFFGSKKACEPLHIQLNAATDSVEVVNECAGNNEGLIAHVEISDMNGRTLWQEQKSVDSREDSTQPIIKISVPANITDVYYIKLTLNESSGHIISENVYVKGREEGNLKALRTLKKIHVESQVAITGNNATVKLTNNNDIPALMLRLELMGNDGEQILPVNYSDNYFHLMPGEEKAVHISWNKRDTRGAEPMVVIKGFNYQELVH